jgi:Ca-activated chloride channel family protein
MRAHRLLSVLLAVTLLSVAACRRESTPKPAPNGRLDVLSGSENESLKPIIDRFARENGVDVHVDYRGSIDIMLALEDDSGNFDAVWPASSIWIDMGDVHKRVKHAESIMRSPVVFAVKKPVAQRLGWVGKDVTVADILAAAGSGKIRYMMTSATQSNSGASAYLGYLSSFAGNTDVLTSEQLHDPAIAEKTRRLLGSVNRSAGSSGWLKDLFLDKYDQYDGMVNYESLVIEANRVLVKQGRDPLYAIYPVDGLAIADHPLAYVDRGNGAKDALFQKLQRYLLSPAVQREILASGRRVGPAGVDAGVVDASTFNPDWGIDSRRILSPIRYPSRDVIREALTLYQTTFRKPSITVYCLDFSGSMRDAGQDDLKGAMRILLDQATASRFLLQTSSRDITVVIPFSSNPIDRWSAKGNGANDLGQLLGKITALQAEGGTDIFTPVMQARQIIRSQPDLEGYSPAIILMTDGKSESGMTLEQFRRAWGADGHRGDIPIYSITFGQADDTQLKQLAALSSGRVFDGRSDLVRAFRQARGYN